MTTHDCGEFERLSPIARKHAARPESLGTLEDYNGHARITGPCGDTMAFWLYVEDHCVQDVSFVTDGCGSSLACGSMAVALTRGKLFKDAATLSQQDILTALGGLPEDMAHCALLASNTLKAACQDCLENGLTILMEDNATNPGKDLYLMRIAIPLAEGKLAQHFGHCASFALLDVDPAQKKIVKREDVAAPPHQPGLLPPWLAERGATVIIAGGMGQRAQQLFVENNIQVLVGAPAHTPEAIVEAYLQGTLTTGVNMCDH